MPDETSPRSPETTHGGGHPGGGGGEQSPLQVRAAFFENRHWESVISLNRGACARGGARHGFNSETGGACAAEWDTLRQSELTLAEALAALRRFHRLAPFLFFNGNTFAEIGRQTALAIFGDLPVGRRKDASSAVAHYVAGVLDQQAMSAMINSLYRSATVKAGDRVRTLKGSLAGVIVRVLDDGRLLWRPDGTDQELVALPESLLAL